MPPTLPLNAVHVAEDAATLDVLTGGNYIPWADRVRRGAS
jgi:hypothetical protein